MRLGIDAREIQNGVYTGIGQPLANFLNYFSTLATGDECIIFSSKPVPMNFSKNIKNTVINETLTFYWDQVKLPNALKKERIDLFYSPYYKIPLYAQCDCINAILDLMYLVYDEYKQKLGPIKSLYYRTFGRECARRAYRILTCSEHSKSDIIRLFGIKSHKIDVIPLSVNQSYRPCQNLSEIEQTKDHFNITGPYILYMGNFKPHKNVKNIILAFEKITKQFPDVKLVLAGPKCHLYYELLTLAKKLSLQDKVIFPGKILKKDKPHLLYEGAEVFVMPSFYEGFGLPPVEAMACGTPVVASNTTSMPEVIKDAGLLIPPENIEAIAEALKRILQDKDLRENLISKGLQYAQEYNEEKINKKMYDYFKNISERAA